MPSQFKDVKIVKIPLPESEKLPDYPAVFPRMPILYLELLENKAKIKQDLINKDYVPPKEISGVSFSDTKVKKVSDKVKISKKEEDESISIDTDSDDEIQDTKRKKTEKSDSISVDSKASVESKGSISPDSDSNVSRTPSSQSSPSDSDDQDEDRKNKDHKDHKDHKHKDRKDRRDDKHSGEEIDVQDEVPDRDEDDLSVRLKELLGDSSRSEEKYSKRIPRELPKDTQDIQRQTQRESQQPIRHDRVIRDAYRQDKYNIPHKVSVENKLTKSYMTYSPHKIQSTVPAPSLAELEAKGQYHGKSELRDINQITTSEYEEEDKKREIIFKFDLLRKSYPLAGATIPEYTIHTDLREMQKAYDSTVKKLSLDSTVETYKSYMITGFMVVEYTLGNFLGFDMQGFSQQQIVNIGSYERLLIELGEKSYVPEGSNWPVELRLLAIIVMNAGIFIISKMMMKKTGVSMLNMINSMMKSNTVNLNTQQPQAKAKRRMKGPNINLDEIPDISEVNMNVPPPNQQGG